MVLWLEGELGWKSGVVCCLCWLVRMHVSVLAPGRLLFCDSAQEAHKKMDLLLESVQTPQTCV